MNTFQCPECGYGNPFGAKSCTSCLLIFEKHNKKLESQDDVIRGTSGLNQLWEAVLADYNNLEKHENFIKQAYILKGLPFASQQYRKMLEINSTEEIAIKMREKIITMATVSFSMPDRAKSPQGSRTIRNIIAFIAAILLVLILSIILIR